MKLNKYKVEGEKEKSTSMCILSMFSLGISLGLFSQINREKKAYAGSHLDPLTTHLDFDAIELNHVHDPKGCLLFTQAILWRLEATDGKYHNWGWKTLQRTAERPWRGRDGRWWMVHCTAKGRLLVSARVLRHRSTQEDMERLDTKLFWGGVAPNVFLMEKEVRVGE